MVAKATIRTLLAVLAGAVLAIASPSALAHRMDDLVVEGCTDIDLRPDPTRAIEPCTKLIDAGALDGDRLAAVLRHRGDAYFRTAKYQSALDAYTAALEIQPDYPRALWNRANLYYFHGYTLRALGDLNIALSLDPDYANAHETYGAVFAGLGRWKAALKSYTKALDQNPDMFRARYNRSISYYNLSEDGLALQDLDYILKNDRETVNRDFIFRGEKDLDLYALVLLQRGRVLQMTKRYDRAVEDLDKVVRLFPESLEAYGERAIVLASANRQQDAVDDFTKAIELGGVTARNFWRRAIARAKLNNLERAFEDLSLAMEIDPKFARAYLTRAHLYGRLKNTELALADFDKAFELDGRLLRITLSRLRDYGFYRGPDRTYVNEEIRNGLIACVIDPNC